MRLAQSLATGEDVNHAYEFAVEARAAEPLRILPSQLSRHALSSEFARVCRQPIDGMYVIPSACDQFSKFKCFFFCSARNGPLICCSLVWTTVYPPWDIRWWHLSLQRADSQGFSQYHISSGRFFGDILRMLIYVFFDKTVCNFIYFQTVKFDLFIFHPNIDPTSRRPDLTRYFPDGWKKDKHHIQNVLLVVQRLFFSFEFDPESSANPAAATMWREDKEKFRSIAKNCVNQSRMEVYDEPEDANDPNVLRYLL
ncbi:unnamed protein product [Strongylus vulgaris]|uniref:UBC core domain-containing protein n=1 Tax=Strongylus vulgaris TaxID=40348 RepID=A0A3P7INC8_STRVU|nr:unnamed protein product [Strongylus vulgaris]